ncbi:RNA polymerase subunit sigma-70 [Conexibacter arvalis]|uniref:RNA polymerase sigma factor n=1 Tax=Conexibacter arvalis TaxID=912552 RepID=A0A840I783_9ACTN|nr:RNA polymerase subunit sigma-70 [Conexibacter arvalis]MBB4660717.1 RNA polymerase sigma-70 factor (ECF subfamily) [Conexibacter arvalis]
MTTAPDDDFAARLAPYRRELHVHCYRMLANFDEAEDLVQETFLRAWSRRETFGGELRVRAWLYRIATNACLDALRRSRRQAPTGSYAEIPWLQPYPDPLLDEAAPSEEAPDAVVVARETIELAFLAAIQLLPPRQRAVLILRDVLEWSAAETADALDLTVASANSALQRARATLEQRASRDRPAAAPSPYEQELLARFVDAHERQDADAALAAVRDDIRVTMPPYPWLFEGVEAIAGLLARAFGGGEFGGDWRLLPTAVNRMPAAASYLRRDGDTVFRPMKLDVLRVEGDRIAEITTFGPQPFAALGLPPSL